MANTTWPGCTQTCRTEFHMTDGAYQERAGRRVMWLQTQPTLWCLKARPEFRWVCPCTLLAGCRSPAQSPPVEQLPYHQELHIRLCSRPHLEQVTVDQLQGFPCHAVGPWLMFCFRRQYLRSGLLSKLGDRVSPRARRQNTETSMHVQIITLAQQKALLGPSSASQRRTA